MKRLITSEWLRKTLRRQLLAGLALAALAICVRLGLGSWLGEHHGLLPGYLAVAAATWLATWRAGLLVAAITLAAMGSPMFAPTQALESAVQEAASVFTFAIVSGLLMYLTHHAYRRMHALSDEVTRLDAADHQKSDFLALIAHELRNPLSAMGVAAGLIKSGRLDGTALQGAWDMVERQTSHMTRLVGDLLDAARIEQGKIGLQLETASIAELIEQAVVDASPHTSAREQRVEVHYEADPGQASVDPLRIRQVLVNLLHNASKFSPKGAAIRILVKLAPQCVVITVKDNGQGIPLSQLGAIFNSFVQLEPVSGRPQGLGLGLALCKKLVEMHGGSIAAHSEGLGAGSELIVTLPHAGQGEVVPPNTQACPACAPPPVALPTPPACLRILVVDDNRDAAESLALLMDLSGHHSSTAVDGQSALAQVALDRPDFVFLDIGLPDMSGHEVAQRLRQTLIGRQPVLVALTGWGGEENIRLSRQHGFDAHLTKPVTLEQIAQALSLKARPYRASAPVQFAAQGGHLELSAQ